MSEYVDDVTQDAIDYHAYYYNGGSQLIYDFDPIVVADWQMELKQDKANLHKDVEKVRRKPALGRGVVEDTLVYITAAGTVTPLLKASTLLSSTASTVVGSMIALGTTISLVKEKFKQLAAQRAKTEDRAVRSLPYLSRLEELLRNHQVVLAELENDYGIDTGKLSTANRYLEKMGHAELRVGIPLEISTAKAHKIFTGKAAFAAETHAAVLWAREQGWTRSQTIAALNEIHTRYGEELLVDDSVTPRPDVNGVENHFPNSFD